MLGPLGYVFKIFFRAHKIRIYYWHDKVKYILLNYTNNFINSTIMRGYVLIGILLDTIILVIMDLFKFIYT